MNKLDKEDLIDLLSIVKQFKVDEYDMEMYSRLDSLEIKLEKILEDYNA